MFVVLLIDVTIVHGQPVDILTSTQRNIRVDNSITSLESIEPNIVRILFHPPLKDTVFIREYKDTIGQFYFSITALGSEINIQYLNDSVWFLFGTRTEYASYPFILKTINSGESWQTIMQSWPSNFDQPIYNNKFHMFDELNGIWIIDLINNNLKYRVTNNGGFTWRSFNIRLKNSRNLKIGNTILDITYFDNGLFQFSTEGYIKMDGNWTSTSISPMCKSKKLGKKFRIIKN